MGDEDLGITPIEASPQEQPPQDRAPASSDDSDLGITPVSAANDDSDLGITPAQKPPGEYDTIGQQAAAGLEGIAKGVAGPLATYAEKHILGVPEEDIAGRAEANPWTHGIGEATGMVGSMLTGYGEAALVAKAANAATKSLEIGKVAQGAIKLGMEAGLFHMGDNASDMILDKTDPEAPVAALLAGIPASVILGGTLGAVGSKAGAKLQEIANGKAASKASQWLADFGSRFEFLNKNKDVVGAATEEAQHLFDTVSSATEGGFSLKRASIDKLTQNIDPAVTGAYVNGMLANLENAPKAMRGNELFQDAVEAWKQRVLPKADIIGGQAYSPAAADVFEATDMLKRQLQEWGQYNKQLVPLAEQPFRNSAKALAAHLKDSLENSGAWGDMGKFQKELNGAYSQMQAPLKDFISAAMSKKEGLPEVDPAKIASVFRSVTKGKPGVGFKADKIGGFFEPAKNFLDAIESLHNAQGIESGLPKVPTNVLSEMLNQESPKGAQAADWLFGAGPGAIGWAGSHAAGTAAGAVTGHPYLGYRAGEHLYPLLKEMGMKPTRWAVATVLKGLASADPAGIPQALNYANGMKSGANRIESSVENLFRLGGKQAMNSDFSEKERDDLDKFVKGGVLNQQIQNQANPPLQKKNPTQGFAHGGLVMAPEPEQPVTKPVPNATKGIAEASGVFPETSMMLGAAKGRINNYLNSIRPQEVQGKLPFDSQIEDKEKKRVYHRALNLANRPLSILDSIKMGKLEPEQVAHMQQLHPELMNNLQKRITKKVVEAQQNGERPPYAVRQSMSLFLGSPLDSTMTPQNILAAQATFVAQKQQQQSQVQPQGKAKASANPALSKMATPYRTQNEASQLRKQQSS